MNGGIARAFRSLSSSDAQSRSRRRVRPHTNALASHGRQHRRSPRESRCRRWGSNPHALCGHRLSSPPRLPVPPHRPAERRNGRRADSNPADREHLRSQRSVGWYDTRAMRIGILTGGGDVPGLNPCIKAVVNRVAHDGHEVVGLRRGWAALLQHDPDDPASAAEWFQQLTPSVVRTIDRTGGTFLHTSRTNPSRVRPGDVPAHPRRPRRRRRAVRLHRPRPARRRVARHRRADPDRRRRHAVVRAADARRGRAGDRDPEDDGQRRPRDRLLHRLLDRRHARRAVHPQPAHVDRARTSGSPSSSCSAATAARRR